ncbi:MAG TPA: DUF929 family protein [Mycobacteriales bacterium]|nr:DUF929 family protein [Mycobacteriales bacterium]
MGRETNKQRRERQATTAREKAAAARAVQARVDQRRRAKAILSSVVAGAVVVALIVVFAINSGGGNGGSSARPIVQDAILNTVTGVSATDVDTIGQGGVSTDAIKAINDPALTKDGKPEVLFIGAEFCPYCAAERWAIVQALSRFGTFSGLKQIRSSEDNLATFSFYKSSYTSKYLSFNPIEYEDGSQNVLEQDSKAEDALWKKYTGQGSFPFLYYGGKYVQTQVGFAVSDLSGKTWAQVADDLKDPSSQLAKDIVGEANTITAMLCKLTNGQPSSACSASGVSGVTLPQPSA